MSKTHLTAAEHFLKGEELLAEAEEYFGDKDGNVARAARAQAHFAAAALLLDAEKLRHETRALGRTGIDHVVMRHNPS